MNMGNTFHNFLRLGARLQIAVLVRQAYNAVCVGDIDPFGVWPRRIEGYPVGLAESRRKNLADCRLRTSRGHPISADLV